MSNKVDRILESIRSNAGNDIYENVIRACGVFDGKATPKRQSEYLKVMLNELESVCGSDTVSKVMKPCGHKCISENIIKKAKLLYSKTQTLDDFLQLLNEQRIGGGNLHIRDSVIVGVYNKCYCGIAKQTEGISPQYCNCSVGWYERLFTSVFEKPVEVKKIQTILDGSDKCVFEIKIQE